MTTNILSSASAKIAPRVSIGTPRLSLREFSPEDHGDIYRIIAKPTFSFYAFPPADSGEEALKRSARQFIDRMLALRVIDAETGQRENYKLAIYLKREQEKGCHFAEELIGYVAIDEVSEARGEKCDIGYFIDPAHWGKGYATEAARGLLSYLRTIMPGNQIMATVHPDNHPSQRVLRKLGFAFTGEQTELKGQPRLMAVLDKWQLAGDHLLSMKRA